MIKLKKDKETLERQDLTEEESLFLSQKINIAVLDVIKNNREKVLELISN